MLFRSAHQTDVGATIDKTVAVFSHQGAQGPGCCCKLRFCTGSGSAENADFHSGTAVNQNLRSCSLLLTFLLGTSQIERMANTKSTITIPNTCITIIIWANLIKISFPGRSYSAFMVITGFPSVTSTGFDWTLNPNTFFKFLP